MWTMTLKVMLQRNVCVWEKRRMRVKKKKIFVLFKRTQKDSMRWELHFVFQPRFAPIISSFVCVHRISFDEISVFCFIAILFIVQFCITSQAGFSNTYKIDPVMQLFSNYLIMMLNIWCPRRIAFVLQMRNWLLSDWCYIC